MINKRLEKKLETIERHSKMVCKVFQCKFTNLTKDQELYFYRLFKEAKYFYNDLLLSNNIFNYDCKNNICIIKNVFTNNYECRHLFELSSQMKQEIYKRLKTNIKSLSTKKKKGEVNKIGKLKFKSEINSIPLVQYGVIYKIKNNRIYIQSCRLKKGFRLLGLHQIPNNADICNATLYKNNKGYFIYITTFIPKEIKQRKGVIGLDLGLRTTVTDSNGNEYKWLFEETKKLKYYQQKMQSQKYHSNNWFKTYKLFKKEHLRIINRKIDVVNKFIHELDRYKLVAYQNDNISAWAKSRMKGWGKKIQHSIIGRIKSKLNDLETSYKVDRWIATTKLCPCCNTKNEIKLQNDENLYYSCKCGYLEKRDIHSAKNILNIALKATGMDRACELDSRSLNFQV